MEAPIVLVLEDNEFAASVIRRTLELAGYKCVEARNTDHALECCRLHGNLVRALIADLVLPGCRGTDIALRVVAEFPNLAVLFVSGTPIDAWPEIDCRKMTELPSGSAAFLAKPFRPDTMIQKLGMLLSSAGLAAERRSPVPQ